MGSFLLLVFALSVTWLIRRDSRQRTGVSSTSWLPTLWVAILASRPLSSWVGFGGGEDTLEGSPLDRFFYFGLIAMALVVLTRRRLAWGSVIRQNWPVFLFYSYLLLSVLWTDAPFVSGKRWLKESGNILIVLVILTEADPLQAFRAVFVRCAYVLIPLSLLLIRYFPATGRRYNIFSGQMEAVGVTFQKNSLGSTVLVCGLILLWDWWERTGTGTVNRDWTRRLVPPAVMVIAAWLLHLCDSKTSMLCLVVSGAIVSAVRLPLFRQRIRGLGLMLLFAAVGFVMLDSVFGITETVIAGMGRNMTFTGRTGVWRELLRLDTDPFVGTGYMNFWDNAEYRTKLPPWIAYSAHNGYLEVYVAGGILGVGALGIMLLATGWRINRALATHGDYAVVRLAIFVTTLLANFSETNFACMTPIGFLFLLAAIGEVPGTAPAVTVAHATPAWARSGLATPFGRRQAA